MIMYLYSFNILILFYTVSEIFSFVRFYNIAEGWFCGSHQGDCKEKHFQDPKSSSKGNQNSEGGFWISPTFNKKRVLRSWAHILHNP